MYGHTSGSKTPIVKQYWFHLVLGWMMPLDRFTKGPWEWPCNGLCHLQGFDSAFASPSYRAKNVFPTVKGENCTGMYPDHSRSSLPVANLWKPNDTPCCCKGSSIACADTCCYESDFISCIGNHGMTIWLVKAIAI